MCLPSGKQCNPGQSISRVLSTSPKRGWAIISLGRRSPAGSCSLPGTVGRAALPPRREMVPAWPCSGRGLPGRRITAAPVVSYTTLSPLPNQRYLWLGGLLSVALSVGLPLLGVTQHPALWSPDFPPRSTIRAITWRTRAKCFSKETSSTSISCSRIQLP